MLLTQAWSFLNRHVSLPLLLLLLFPQRLVRFAFPFKLILNWQSFSYFAHSMLLLTIKMWNVCVSVRLFSLHICWMSSNGKRIKMVLIKRNWNCIDGNTVSMNGWMNSEHFALYAHFFFHRFFSLWDIDILRSYSNWFPLKATHASPFKPPTHFSKCIQLNPVSILRYRCTTEIDAPSVDECLLYNIERAWEYVCA